MSLSHKNYRTIPRWGKRLSRRFIAAFGKPAGLWMPNDVMNKAYDFSNNLNTGTLNGGVTVVPANAGIFGEAWQFDGSTGYISFPFVTPTKFTVFAWINATSFVGNATRVGIFANSTGNNGWGLECIASQPTLVYWSWNEWTFNTITLSAGKNYLIAMSLDISGGTATCFVVDDGVLSQQTIGSISGLVAANGTCQIGRNTTSFYWDGTIGLLGLSPVFFSAAQISALYSSLLTGKPYSLLDQAISRRGYGIQSQIISSSFRFRRTLSSFGTRTGTRQIMG